MESKLLTIFTPTFNRKHYLPQLYESLKKQMDKDCFEWLIVDDGSTDGTNELVDTWINEKHLEIRYLYQENRGKMVAHNTGVLNCSTKYFLCVDSDDFLVDNAISSVKDLLQNVSINSNLAGLIAYKCDKNGKLICGEFNQDSSTLNDLYRNGFWGDTTLIYKTSALKNHLFPEIESEKFITEDYVYSQIDEEYEMFLFPKPLIICEYLNDGYTKSAIKLLFNNPKGMSLYYNLKIKLSKSLKEKMMFTIRYIAINKIGKADRAYRQCNAKLLYVLLYPFGCLYAYTKIIKTRKI